MKYPLRYPLSGFLSRMGVGISIAVEVGEDKEAGVFVATSKDLPGLILEAETREELIEEINEAIPNLLALDHTKLKNKPHWGVFDSYAHP